MGKSENLLLKFLIVLAGITIGVGIVLTIIAYQIGVDELEKPNRIAIISGLLSMFGGIAGAFGAYFIAKMQMTKQLELQYKKEEEKMIKELKINNYLKTLENSDALLQSLNKLHRLLLESIVEISSKKESFVKYEKYIETQFQEIRELSTKLKIYEVFYEKDFSPYFKNVTKSIKSIKEPILEKWLGYTKKEDLNESINIEVLGNISEEFIVIINQSIDHVTKLLIITQFMLKNATNQKLY